MMRVEVLFIASLWVSLFCEGLYIYDVGGEEILSLKIKIVGFFEFISVYQIKKQPLLKHQIVRMQQYFDQVQSRSPLKILLSLSFFDSFSLG